MAANYVVTTDFVAHSNYGNVMNSMRGETSRFARDARREMKSVSEIFRGSFAGTLTANALTSGFSFARRGIEGVTRDYLQLDQSLNEAAVKFGNIDYGSEKFRELSQTARLVGRTTKFSAMDAAGGLEAIAAAGFEANNAIKLLPAVANFAAAAKMDLASGAQVAGEALNAFAMNAKDAETQTKNLIRISDILAESDRMSNASMQGLAETVSWGAASMTNAGQKIETFGAIAAGLADNAKHGSVAGTILRGMAESISNRTPKAEKALKKLLGPEWKSHLIDAKGDIKDMIGILGDLEGPLKKLGTAERGALITDIFDIRAGEGVKSLLGSGISKLVEYQKRLEETSGTAERSGEQLTKSLSARVELLKNAAEEKGYQVLDRLMGGGGNFDKMMEKIDKFDVEPIVRGVTALGDAFGFVVEHSDGIMTVAKAMLMMKGVMMTGNALRWGMDMTAALRGITSMAPAMAGVAGSIGSVGGTIAAGGSAQAKTFSGPQTVMVGANAGTRTSWNGKTIVGPSSGGTALMMTPPPAEKMKLSGAQIANGFVAVVQAAGIGYSIGTAIEAVLESYANDVNKDYEKKGAPLVGGRTGGYEKVISEADLDTKQGNLTLEAVRQDLAKKTYEKRAERYTLGFTVKDFISTYFGEGQTLSQQSNEQLEAISNLNQQIIEKLDPTQSQAYMRDLMNEFGDALESRGGTETKVTIELTGPGADQATVKDIKTTKDGPQAPSVNKSRSGKQ